MPTPDLHTFDPRAARDRLAKRLTRFRRRARRHVGLAGATRVVLLAAALAVASFVIDHTFRLGVGLRLVLLAAGLVAIAAQAWRHVVTPLRRRVDLVQLADVLDRAGRSAPLAPRVATVLALDTHGGERVAPSAAMVRSAVMTASRSLDRENLTDRLDDRRPRRHVSLIAAVLGGGLLIAALAPAMTGLWARRWFAGSNQPWPQKTYLDISGLTADGRLLVPRGESATVFVRVRAGSQEPPTVAVRVQPQNGPRVDSAMTRYAAGDFRHDLPPVQAPLTLEAEGGDDEIGPVRVEPVDRPRIESLRLVGRHPTEAADTVHAFGGDALDPTFLPQTALRLVVRANTPAERITVGEDASVTRLDDRTAEVRWTHARAMHFRIEITGAGTGLTSAVTPLTVGLLVDAPPRVSLAHTGVRQRVTPQATIPLTAGARDDYGVHDLKLVAKVDYLDPADQKRQLRDTAAVLFGPQHPAAEKEVQVNHGFSVATLNAPVGALVGLVATAADERYEGAQTGRSKEATFRVVSAEELFREILLRQQGERAKFRKAADEAAAIRQELRASPDVVGLAKRHRVVQREASRVATVLGESLTEMRCNALGTVEAQDLMQRTVLGPLKELSDGLMAQQRDALDALAPNADTAAAGERQEQIVLQMNAVLKQMAQWDSFVDVINQLNEIIRLQEKARLTTEQLRKKEADSAFD